MDVNKLAALTFSSEGPRFLAYKMFPHDYFAGACRCLLGFFAAQGDCDWLKEIQTSRSSFFSLDMPKFCARESFWQFESAKSDLHCHHSALTDAFSQPTFGLVKEGKPQV